jgi:hypothetical protein
MQPSLKKMVVNVSSFMNPENSLKLSYLTAAESRTWRYVLLN